MSTIEVKVPALGDFKDVPIIDVLVKPGDAVSKDDALVTLESEKATMDVPSPAAGTIKDLRVKVGDRVSEGSVVLTLDEAGAARPAAKAAPPSAAKPAPPAATKPAPSPAPAGKRDGAAAPAARAAEGAAKA
ncbi:biotin/lipoyl-containing protein, partial [Anaeromyxobacter sp. SG17]